MHVSRLMGLNGCARTEERVARLLKNEKQVVLQNSSGPSVVFKVETVWFENVSEGKKAVTATIAAHKRLEGETTRNYTSCDTSIVIKTQEQQKSATSK